MNTIITVFTVLSMYLNLSQGTNNEHFYNATIEDGVVSTLYVYDNHSDYLVPSLAFHFSYDEEGRLSEKSAYSWDGCTRTFEPYYKLQYTYFGTGYELSHCTWSENTKTWTPSGESMVYNLNNDQVRMVTHIRNKSENETPAVNQLLIQDPYEDYLLAMLTKSNMDF